MFAQLSRGMRACGALRAQPWVRRAVPPAGSAVLPRAAPAFSTQAPGDQAQRLAVLQAVGTVDLEKLAADSALDGPLKELQQALERQGAAASAGEAAAAPDGKDLALWAVLHGTPFVAFGFMDNALMLLAGDFIDSTLGATLGVSTMLACGIGNIIGDISGVFAASPVEAGISAVAAALRLPMPNLTAGQKCLPVCRAYKTMGCVVGVVLGCLLGMFPLVWPLEWRLWSSRNTLSRS